MFKTFAPNINTSSSLCVCIPSTTINLSSRVIIPALQGVGITIEDTLIRILNEVLEYFLSFTIPIKLNSIPVKELMMVNLCSLNTKMLTSAG